MSKKKITIDQLAAMVAEGFESVLQQTATKDDIARMESRLERIENVLLANHDRRLENLEDFMRLAKTALRLK